MNEHKETAKRGIIYCLTNSEMPDLVKIGRVVGIDTVALKKRMKDLYSTGVPVPFELHYAVEVDDVQKTEENIHNAFNNVRENPRREFFRIDRESVASAMKLTGGSEVLIDDTLDGDEIVQADIDARDRARQRENKRSSAFKFSDVGIPKGAELTFSRDDSITAKVLGDKKITFKNKENTLSGSAGIILEGMGLKGNVAGPLYWKYNGEVLDQIRRRKEAESESEE